MSRFVGIPLLVVVLALSALLFLRARSQLFPRAVGMSGGVVQAEDFPGLTVYYHERPPYYFRQDERIEGIVGRRVSEALARSGVVHRWVEMSPARQLELVREGNRPAAAVGWFENEDRRQFARFSPAISQDAPTVVVARADDTRLDGVTTVASILRFPGLVLLLKETYSYGAGLDRLIVENAPRLERTPADNEGMVRMLEVGRADYFFAAAEEADELLRRSGGQSGRIRVIRPVDMPPGNRRHVMFNRWVDQDTLERINAAIETVIGGDGLGGDR